MNFSFSNIRQAKEGVGKKSKIRDWAEAVLFAVVAATLIRTFIFEAFVIPSSSMERTLLINDYIFVSKISYGPRIPMTPLAIPFTHHTLPFTRSAKPYSTAVQWPYRRLPGFSSIKRNDVIVFNYPCGDTVLKDKNGHEEDYYSMMKLGPDYVRKNYEPPITRPVDKRENWIKRCIAVAGDTLQIMDGVVYINGQAQELPRYAKARYLVTMKDTLPLNDRLLEKMKIEKKLRRTRFPGTYMYYLTAADADTLRTMGGKAERQLNTYPDARIFPFDTKRFEWNEDCLGPIYVPAKGGTVILDTLTLPLYRRIIETYEHNRLTIDGDKIFINGVATNSYTFKMNYYWMMGDNRNESTDSRFWGFVPEDHVVGKAWVIWMSFGEHGVRWRRLFSSIR